MSDLFDTAHARRTDPATSHEAAAKVTPQVPALQQLVANYAKERPTGFCDRDLVEHHPDLPESSLRTRRSELTARNVILDSGRKCRIGNNRHIVWLHRDFVPDAPPIVAADKDQSPKDQLKDQAKAMATEFDGYARAQRAEGRAFLADRLEAAAQLFRALGR